MGAIEVVHSPIGKRLHQARIARLPFIMKEAGLVQGTGEAVRLLKQGGVKVNDAVVSDTNLRLQQGEHIVKVGKKKFYKIIVRA